MTACSVTHVTRGCWVRRAPDEPDPAHPARPDLWHAWSALIGELVSRNELDDALGQAQDAVARFPLLAAVWLDLAMVCRACGDADGEVGARACPDDQPRLGHRGTAVRAQAYEKQGNYDQSGATLERRPPTARWMPTTTGSWPMRRNLGRQDEAIDRLVCALRLDPGYNWAWEQLQLGLANSSAAEIPLGMARELTEQCG